MTTDTDALLATVRGMLATGYGLLPNNGQGFEAALAALDSLAAELRTLAGERQWIEERHGRQADRANHAEAELERVKAERDAALDREAGTSDAYQDLLRELGRMVARLDKALSALREIEQKKFPIFVTGDFDPLEDAAAHARAAIAEIEGEA